MAQHVLEACWEHSIPNFSDSMQCTSAPLPCPNCSAQFPSPEDVVQHLSTECSCGQLADQNVVQLDADKEDDEDEDDADEGDFNFEQVVYDTYGDDLGNTADDWVGHETDTTPLESPLSSPTISNHRRIYHPNKSRSHPGGMNLFQRMDQDKFAQIRDSDNVYYPFACRSEWELANWLSSGSLSQREIDEYLHSERNLANPLSFRTAKDLRARIEALPDMPSWHVQEIKVAGYRTKQPMMLYWRDGLDVVKHLFSNPIFASHMDYDPYREFEETAMGQESIYGEFMSAQRAWEIQSKLPAGHSFVGVIGASDKTPLTKGAGNKEMHPVLLSLANIHANIRMKATSHAFTLAAYLPIPKFVGVPPAVQSVLSARVYHFAMSVVMQNLKKANLHGEVMSDPEGNLRVVHTPLVAWIADYPEQLLIAGVSSKNSPISHATTDHFGDPTPSLPRLRQSTLDAIREACRACDPCDIASFHKVCLALRLNGIVQPFWADWGDACPSSFLTPDALHQWHKFFFDHCVRWLINIMGSVELDRRLSVLQPRIGTRQWPNGVTTLKQTGGKDHRDLERVLPAVAAGGVNSNVLCALRAMTEFIFLAQRMFHCEETLHALGEALREFHHYKQSIIDAGGRQGKHGPLNHFEIPKLELTHHVVRSTRAMGAPYQWTSDITERCHITLIKIPYRSTNRRDFHEQCCRFLDRQEKQRIFCLFTKLKTTHVSLVDEMRREEQQIQLYHPRSSSNLSDGQYGLNRTSLFNNPHSCVSQDGTRASLVTARPHFCNLSVDEASRCLGIPDLRPALGDFYSGRSYTSRNGRRLAPSNCHLPFSSIHAWSKFRIQVRSSQNPLALSPPETVQAEPPSPSLPFGRANTVLIVHESGDQLSTNTDGKRYIVAQVQGILQPISNVLSPPLLYVKFFNFSNVHFAVVDGVRVAAPVPHLEMFLVRRRVRNDGQPLGDIIPLDDVRQVVQLIPKFGPAVPQNMTCDNSLELGGEFYLNSFASKETFHAVLSLQ